MAHYAYKTCIYERIPEAFRRDYEKRWKEETGRDFEACADYDGDYWHLVAGYVDALKAEIVRLEVALSNHRRRDHHVRPVVVALRRRSAVCVDEFCELSGGHAHAGPCEPCDCPERHAVSECPARGGPPDEGGESK